MKIVKIKDAVKEFIDFLSNLETGDKVLVMYGGALFRYYISKRKSGYNEFYLKDEPYMKRVMEQEGWTVEELKDKLNPDMDSGEAVILRFCPAAKQYYEDDLLNTHSIQATPIQSLKNEDLLSIWTENFEKCGDLGTISYAGPYLYKGDPDEWENNQNLDDYAVIIDYVTEEELKKDIEEWRKDENVYITSGPTEDWFMEEIKKLEE